MSIFKRVAAWWNIIQLAVRSRSLRQMARAREWYVRIPQHMRGEMVAHSGTIEDALDEMAPDNRRRLATIGCVGIQFMPSGELHRWPWLEDERAWWQAIA